MFDQEHQKSEEFLMKVFDLLKKENPEYHIAFMAFMTLAITVANEMGMELEQFTNYATYAMEKDRQFVASEMQ